MTFSCLTQTHYLIEGRLCHATTDQQSRAETDTVVSHVLREPKDISGLATARETSRAGLIGNPQQPISCEILTRLAATAPAWWWAACARLPLP